MNEFLTRIHKQIMCSISELAPNTGTLSVDIAVDDSIGGMLYRFNPKYQTENKHIVILAISSDVEMSDSIAGVVYSLMDNIGIKDDRLVIIHSNGKSKQENDIYTFLSEEVDIFHPDYLRLSVSIRNLQCSIDEKRFIGLRNILEKYYSGEITFIGSVTGKQFVNIEIYRDPCNSCKKEIAVVSGIVFPKIQMPLWNNTFWQYYNTLISIYSLPSEYSKQIKRVVNKLRKKNTNITPLIFYQDIEAEESDWTVMCPHCKTVINPYEPSDHRMRYLFNFDGRINGNLSYHSILIDASQELINLLDEMSESTPHAYHGGWLESKTYNHEP